ncbi:MAG: PQQ-binding-like beta-propeller repeat protein [Candidatus Sulfobium sp.]|jgi:outer membrane protein assembly factor BamB
MKKRVHLLFLFGILCLLVSGCGHSSSGSSAIIGGGGEATTGGGTGSGSINGAVWKDFNKDRTINPGEPGIPDVHLVLFKDSNGNGSLDRTDEQVSTTTTDSNGSYSFTVTSGGRYFVSVDETQPSINGLTLTTNNEEPAFEIEALTPTATLRVDITDPNGSIQNVNFGFFSPVKWSFNIAVNGSGSPFPSPFISSPAIAPDGTLYAGSGNDFLYAVNPDGTLKWTYEAGQAAGQAMSASPAIGSDGTIYAASYDRQLYALSPDGALKWVFPTKTVLSSSPAIGSDGTIYAGGTNMDVLVYSCGVTVTIGRLYAVNPDGSKKWEFALSGVVNSSPTIGTDGTIYIASEGDILNDRTNICDDTSDFPPSDADPGYPVNGHLYALNPDGTLKWEFRALGPMDSSPSIGSDGTIYVGSDGTVTGYGATSHEYVTVAPKTIGYLYALDPSGQLKWFTDLFGNVKSSPAIGNDGTIYVGSDKEDFFALSPDGSIKWQFPTRGPVRSSPALASDGTIYVGSDDGSLYALNPDGTLKSRIITTQTAAVNSSPNIAPDGTVYFATGSGDSKVYAVIGDSPLADTPWPRFRKDAVNNGLK